MKKMFKSLVVAVLTIEARIFLLWRRPKIIAVTGSVGKTSAKEAIAHVLARVGTVRKSQKSFNSELGVPLAILGLNNGWGNPIKWIYEVLMGIKAIFSRRPKYLVLEVGTDMPGDIQSIASWLRPDTVVFTAFSKTPVHLEFFESVEAIFREKTSLISNMNRNGTLVLNGDDEDVRRLETDASGKIFTFGFLPGVSVRGSEPEIMYGKVGGIESPIGIIFSVEIEGKKEEISLQGVVGRQHVFPVLSAIAVGVSEGMMLKDCVLPLESMRHNPGRMRIISGIKSTTIIDDTYNASPIAVSEALNTLQSVKAKRRIVLLSDMLELGKKSAEAHQAVGKEVTKATDVLMVAGLRARGIAEGALGAGMSEKNIYQFEDGKEASVFLERFLEEGDVVLIKGSQRMRLERVVEDVMAEPERAGELLARQESEWKSRP